jgi:hypothetical protein
MRRVLFVLVATITSVANANPAAEKLFEDGRKLFAEGKLDEACDAFRRSEELEPRVGTLLNLGSCEEKRGKTATAWVAFVDARELGKRTKDRRLKEAEKRAAALEPVLPHLTIKLDANATAGVTVQRNGTQVAPAELGIDAPIDPGSYTIEASASGFTTWTKTVELTAGAHETVEVPALVAVAQPTAPVPAAAESAPPSAPPPVDAAPPAAAPRSTIGRHLGIGVVGGYAGSPRAGVRISAQLFAMSSGAIRAIVTGTYGQPDDFSSPPHAVRLIEASAGFEYAATLAPRFVMAGGLSLGTAYAAEQMVDPYGELLYVDLSRRESWWALRVAPTLRLGRIDLALLVQLYGVRPVYTTPSASFDVSIDYFFW